MSHTAPLFLVVFRNNKAETSLDDMQNMTRQLYTTLQTGPY